MLKYDAFEQGGKNGKSERMWRAASNQQSAFKIQVDVFSKVPKFEFVDQLKAAGQGCWQILPLGPTSYGDSPYPVFFHLCRKSFYQSGRPDRRGSAYGKRGDAVDFGSRKMMWIMRKIYKGRYKLFVKPMMRSDISKNRLCKIPAGAEAHWLGDYALFYGGEGSF